MNEIKATVFDIQRFSLNDGPGIRTTVFLKGCPLNCLWCHNPESKSAKREIMLHTARCVGCGACLAACPDGLHSFGEGNLHIIDRKKCKLCGSCEATCSGAIKMCGREMSVSEVMSVVERDAAFYKNSGGGMTVSGGEPLMHPTFTLALAKAAKARGIHTAIETSGYAKWDVIASLISYVDLFLWDVKETDDIRHREYTGVSREPILENLRRLSAAGARIALRCPIIPSLNDRDAHLENIGRLADELVGVVRVDVEPYHPLGKSKALALGKDYPLEDLTFPADEKTKEWISKISKFTSKPVQKG